MVAVCNGRFFGGGMMVAPDADLADRQFDVVIVRASGKLGLIWALRLIYAGRHRHHHSVTILRGQRVTVEPLAVADDTELLVEIDGEALGRCPATFEIVPQALILKC